MKINVRPDIDAAVKNLNRAAKQQVPYATSLAVNEVAVSCEKEIAKQIKSNIDNPTAFTQNSTFVVQSNKSQSPITAIVGIKDKQAEYLDYGEYGGVSVARGKAKPVPTSHSKNKFGNIPRGKIGKILVNEDEYFAGTPKGGNRIAGVYRRVGKYITDRKRKRFGNTGPVVRYHKLSMVAHWEKMTSHSKRTRFGERVRLRVDRDLPKTLSKKIAAAIDSAK